jgi:hypothetical protein
MNYQTQNGFEPRAWAHAPNRVEIARINDLTELEHIVDRSEEVAITVKNQLDNLDLTTAERHRKVDALSYWKIAGHHAAKRLQALRNASGRPEA